MLQIHYGINDNSKNSKAIKSMFSHGNYRCERALLNRKGEPVGVMYNTVMGIWMVANGTCTVFFGDYAEAMAYCRSRFTELDGGPIRK